MIKNIFIGVLLPFGFIIGVTLLLFSKKTRKEWLQDSEYAEFFSKRI